MRSSILLVFLMLLGCAELMAEPDQVKISTNMGDIVIKLDAKAPNTVKNFLEYVDAGYYDGSIFHRVIPGFMIQGGGFGPEMNRIETRAAIQNEADNGLKNKRGSIAMARTGDPHSASAQFFINVADNKSLDHSEKSPRGWGYAVFGEVISGMDIVDKIVAVPRGNAPPSFQDVPKTTVLIKSATRVE